MRCDNLRQTWNQRVGKKKTNPQTIIWHGHYPSQGARRQQQQEHTRLLDQKVCSCPITCVFGVSYLSLQRISKRCCLQLFSLMIWRYTIHRNVRIFNRAHYNQKWDPLHNIFPKGLPISCVRWERGLNADTGSRSSLTDPGWSAWIPVDGVSWVM